VIVDRLESGFLLFETQQGLVRVELSLRHRIYLLWTFRNFHQLPVPLLNQRQRILINELFRNHAEVVSHLHDPSLVIGMVENFVPTTVPIDADWPAQNRTQEATQKEERQEQVVAQPAEVAPQHDPVSSSSPKFVWPRFVWPRFAWSKLKTSKLRTSRLTMSRLTMPRLTMPGLTPSRLATTAGALFLCIVSVGAWHRMQAVPSSQAHNQTRLQPINAITVTDSPRPAEPAAIAENAAVSIPPAASAQIPAAPKAAVKSTSIAAVIRIDPPTHTSTHTPTPKRAIRVHDAASIPNLALSSPDSGIQASRPPLHFAYPAYPDVRVRGVVALTAGLDSEGAVRTVRIVSGNRALAAAAAKAVRQWRYRPYLKDGQPVATETNIVISFFSDDAISMSFPPSIPTIR